MPCLSDVLRAGFRKERRLTVVLEGRPVAADSAVVGYDGLEDATVVVGMMTMLWWQHYVAGLIANEIFVVGRNQQELTLSEAPCAAIICQSR